MRCRLGLTTLALLVVLAGGCTTIRPVGSLDGELGPGDGFSHEAFGRVLERFVDEDGLVDYAALRNDPHDLDHYYLLLATYSPDSHPELFPDDASRLAYWLNAYNAFAMKIVLIHYPIASVRDVRLPWFLCFLPREGGFFAGQRVICGGEVMNLLEVENDVIRKRFPDPRIHFALNCASRGCPRLPREVFDPARLDSQLDRETRHFFAESRNLHVDKEAKTVHLSSILRWYKGDFVRWQKDRFPDREATLLNYVALYVSGATADTVREAASYDTHFIPYDWGLNDQALPSP